MLKASQVLVLRLCPSQQQPDLSQAFQATVKNQREGAVMH